MLFTSLPTSSAASNPLRSARAPGSTARSSYPAPGRLCTAVFPSAAPSWPYRDDARGSDPARCARALRWVRSSTQSASFGCSYSTMTPRNYTYVPYLQSTTFQAPLPEQENYAVFGLFMTREKVQHYQGGGCMNGSGTCT
ncbi:hypothetical protein C8Q77DRAFT_1274520 [Trametes polyzona]|nr:hypothetical protein C8Q77DRAFT_1274520 [Trametes polyzona]